MEEVVKRTQLMTPQEEREYWLSRPVEERFAALEALRREAYGAEAVERGMDKSVVRIIRLREK